MFVPDVSFAVAFFAGVASFLSPCVFPLIPSYLSVIAGVSTGELGIHKGVAFKTRVFFNSLFFIMGFSTVFILLGLFSGSLGALVSDIWFARLSGIAVVFMGLFLTGAFIKFKPFYFLYFEKRIGHFPERKFSRRFSYAVSYLTGAVFAAAWTPCVGPVLASILFIAAGLHDMARAGELLSVYSSGLAVPFMAASMGVGFFASFLSNIRPHIRKIQIASGVVLIIMGILMFFNILTAFNAWVGSV